MVGKWDYFRRPVDNICSGCEHWWGHYHRCRCSSFSITQLTLKLYWILNIHLQWWTWCDNTGSARLINCRAKLTFASVVFYCGWLEVLEQAGAVLLLSPQTMVHYDINRKWSVPKNASSLRLIPPLQGLKFGSEVYHNYKVHSAIGGLRLQ